ncbi:MAG: hypothetical protein EOO75_04150, partial [Myxococcales bacterium]
MVTRPVRHNTLLVDDSLRLLTERARRQGLPAEFIEELEEITTQAQAQQQEADLQLSLALSDAIAFELDPYGRFTGVWTRDEALLFFPRDYILGRTIDELFGGQQGMLQLLVDNFRGIVTDGVARDVEYRTPPGAPVQWFRATFSRLQPPGALAPRMFIVVREVSTEVRKREELGRARDEAEAASRSKSEFLANMSHEIRTPIHGVLGLLELLLSTPLSPEQRGYLGPLRASIQALLGLVTDLLDLSKLEAGRVDLVEASFEPSRIVEEALQMVAITCADKEVDLRSEVDHDLPRLIVSDPVRVRQVLINLLVNAAKFTPAGSVVVRVQVVEAKGRDVTLRFTVTDTGIGIPAEHLERIFDSFHQVEDSRARRHGGTGLGLAIARQLAERLGGSLTVRSTVGQGSEFTFVLPGKLPADQPAPAVPQPRRSLAGTVLLVEDNVINMHVARRYLRALGLSVLEAQDGRQALDLLLAPD